jgi:hypothetical protein
MTKTQSLPIAEYKAGDKVQVLMTNPQTNREEWRSAEVLDKRIISPAHGSHHRPYPILIVRVQRTYCKAQPKYRWIDGNIPVFVDNTLEYYDKENDEGILYAEQIRKSEDIAVEA